MLDCVVRVCELHLIVWPCTEEDRVGRRNREEMQVKMKPRFDRERKLFVICPGKEIEKGRFV